MSKFPLFLHQKLQKAKDFKATAELLNDKRLATVCAEAGCPNRLECFSKKSAAFLALGKECTRNCAFCDIHHSKTPAPIDEEEPKKIAAAAYELGLGHIVITMVCRDDLQDLGVNHLRQILKEIKKRLPRSTLELLTPDFFNKNELIDRLLEERPDIFNHNIETARRLNPKIRHIAGYDESLRFLRYLKDSGKCSFVKSGFMVGLGESKEEVFQTIADLKSAGCDIITIGQYLQPDQKKIAVREFIPLERFKEYENHALSLGVKRVISGPFVRSSYNVT